MIPRLVTLATARTLVALVPVVDAVVVGLARRRVAGPAGHQGYALVLGSENPSGALRLAADTKREEASAKTTNCRLSLPPGLCDLLHAYRTARTLRRCTRLLNRVDRAIDRRDRATAERLMERVRVAMAGERGQAQNATEIPH